MRKVIEGTTIEHFEVWPTVDNLISNFEKIVYHQEEPFATASIYAQWEVFKLARENNVTVLLDGQGADEVLAGYTHFFVPYFKEVYRQSGSKSLAEAHRHFLQNNIVEEEININLLFKIETQFPCLPRFLRFTKRGLFGMGTTAEIHPELHDAFRKFPSPFEEHRDLNEALRYFTTVSGLDKLLRFADRNSMAHSCEIRLPFLSHELVEFVFSLPSEYKIREGWTKALLRFSMQDILPPEIVFRKNKLGFQPPQQQWEKNNNFIAYAQELQQVAIQNRYICDNGMVSWKGAVLGGFIQMNSKIG